MTTNPEPLSPEREAEIRQAAIQAVKDHPSTTWMAPYESLADAVLDAIRPALLAELGRVREELAEQRVAELDGPKPPVCGRTRGISGETYPPCTRRAGHGDAYCRSADGSAYFLAIDANQPEAGDR